MRDTVLVRIFGLFEVPLIGWINPRIIEMSDHRSAIEIKLSRRTKNHLNSMYFGVMASGADIAGGLLAMRLIAESGRPISLAFKDFKAKFFKRAESDVVFFCNDIGKIKNFVGKVIRSKVRHHMPVKIYANCPKISDEIIAEFTLTLSLKNKEKSI